jgi:hypothetical protein
MSNTLTIGASVPPGFGVGGGVSGGPDGASRAESWLYRRLRASTGLVRLRDQIHPIMAPKKTTQPAAGFNSPPPDGGHSIDRHAQAFSAMMGTGDPNAAGGTKPQISRLKPNPRPVSCRFRRDLLPCALARATSLPAR